MQTAERYEFGQFVLDTARLELLDERRVVELRPKAYETLLALLRSAGRVVAKDDLVATVWPDVIVNDDALAQCVHDVRNAIGDTDQRYIRTVSRRGYMFIHPVTLTADLPTGPPGERPLAHRNGSMVPAVAVLPFANLSSDPEQVFFADGVVEDLITALSRFHTFAVVARTSTFVYKDRAVDIREVARELGVRYLIEGSVRRSGDRIRVTTQLIDGATGGHLWADRFDGAPADIFDFQDAITDTVIGFVEPQIRKAEIERARQKRPESLDAWDLYVQALPLVHSGALVNWNRAVALLDRAVAFDPAYAPALALAAWARNKRNQLGGGENSAEIESDIDVAFCLAERAVAADPDDALALALEGWLHIHYRLDFSKLERVRRALALNPNNTSVLDIAGIAHMRAGDLDRAFAIATRALDLSPVSPQRYVFMMHIAAIHNALGRHEEAIVFARRVVELEPAYVNAHLALAIACAHLGRLGEAREEVAIARRLRPDVTIAAVMVHRMQYPERVARWVEGLRKAGMPEG